MSAKSINIDNGVKWLFIILSSVLIWSHSHPLTNAQWESALVGKCTSFGRPWKWAFQQLFYTHHENEHFSNYFTLTTKMSISTIILHSPHLYIKDYSTGCGAFSFNCQSVSLLKAYLLLECPMVFGVARMLYICSILSRSICGRPNSHCAMTSINLDNIISPHHCSHFK